MKRCRLLSVIVISFVGVLCIVSARPVSVLPGKTDPAIHAFDAPQYAWVPEGKIRHQLLVFLPGTGGEPQPAMPFIDTAVTLGYHAVSLMYPDSVAAQSVCADSADPDSHLNFRLEIIQGKDLSPFIEVSRTDSIENRLVKLLLYLSAEFPGQGWEEYLDQQNQVVWEKLALAGQSQGGGHAYVLSKIHPVARVMMFGSPKDYSHRFNRPPNGFDDQTLTPKERYFAFNHMQDRKGGCDYTEQLQIFEKMGLTKLGQATVDKCESPYGHAHLLYTDIPLTDQMLIHNAPLNNKRVKNSDGSLRFQKVWIYLLTKPVN